MAGGQSWQVPPGATVAPRGGSVAVAFSPVCWWFVVWRARVLDESAGNVDARLYALSRALEALDTIGGLPGVHLVAPSTVIFEFWFAAGSPREVFGGARAALRQACRTVGIGDPTPPPSDTPGGVMLMFEELPTIRRDDS